MYGSSLIVLISLTLIESGSARGNYDFSDLNHLGDQISRSVNEQLVSLQNLGARISASVQEQLAPIRSGILNNKFLNNINRQFYGLQQPFIPPNQPFAGPNLDLSGLNNLGQQIQENVYQQLEPVRALEQTMKMKNGVGGTTIATHLPEGRKFIITNHQIQECDGSISQTDGKCSGTLTMFQIKEKKDYCYNRQSYSIINNQICIGASTVSVINNEIKCLSNTNNSPLLIGIEEYRKLCEGLSNTVEYKYVANPQDPNHVEIPNKNKYVKCSNNQPGICIFTETNILPNSNNGIIFNSYNSGHVVTN